MRTYGFIGMVLGLMLVLTCWCATKKAIEKKYRVLQERELTAEVRRKNELVHECRERIDELGARLEANAACEGDLRKVRPINFSRVCFQMNSWVLILIFPNYSWLSGVGDPWNASQKT